MFTAFGSVAVALQGRAVALAFHQKSNLNMTPWLSRFYSRLPLRWKLQLVVLPLVIVPLIVVGAVTGYIAYQQAYRGITQASKDDLDHLCRFALDLLDSHYKQFQVYKEDKKRPSRRK
ncbi:MAG: hypothetical protein R2864_02655 [Syntrophotaleaceae bacterium]